MTLPLDARTIASMMGGKVERGCALVPGPGHSLSDRSLSVKPDQTAPDGFVCHSFSGDDFALCRDHVKSKLGIEHEPRRKANGNVTTEPKQRIVATYPYEDESGELLFEVVRLDPKDFRQRRPDGRGGWSWKLGDIHRVPYRLPELIEAIANGYVIAIVEGEKDADTLRRIGINATTCAGGAGKWREEYGTYFGGASVVIIPDNDDVGRDHARQVTEALIGIADRIRVLDIAKEWSQCPLKGDISDWLAAGGTREQLDQLIDNAPDVDEWIASLNGAGHQREATGKHNGSGQADASAKAEETSGDATSRARWLNSVFTAGTGLVASLARPGGNVTGLSVLFTDLAGKRLEYFREVAPNVHRLAVMANVASPSATRRRSSQRAGVPVTCPRYAITASISASERLAVSKPGICIRGQLRTAAGSRISALRPAFVK